MKKLDLVVVGGGILGASHAFAALKKGLTVTLLEKDLYPIESTVRNFGQVVPSGMKRGEWFEYGRKGLSHYAEIQSKYDIGLRNNGSIYIASTPDEMAVNEELYSYYQSIDYPCQLLTKEEVLAKYPSLKTSYVLGAIFFPAEYSAESEVLIHNIHKYLSLSFPDTYNYLTSHTVIDVNTKEGECITTTSNKQTFVSEQVIVCSGRDFKALFPLEFENSGLVVSKLNMFSTKPMPEVKLDGNILTGLTIRRYESFEECKAYQHLDKSLVNPEHVKYGIHILFKQRKDGSIIMGDSHEYAPYNEADSLGFYVNNYITDLMFKEAKNIINLPNWEVALHWAGFYAQCKNADIFHKTIDNKIHIITGIGGKGMTTSMGYAHNTINNLF